MTILQASRFLHVPAGQAVNSYVFPASGEQAARLSGTIHKN